MQKRLMIPILAILGAGATGLSTTQAQPGPSAQCPPSCGIRIAVPEDPTRSPQVDIETLRVRPGQEISWESERPVLVVFPEDTPFQGRNGRPIYQFNTRSTNRLQVREDSAEICSPPGCKYMVVDLGDDQRPPLDPYIIIEP